MFYFIKKGVPVALLFCGLAALRLPDKLPVLYVIGDSTVQNSDGNGDNEYWGWGTLLKPFLDTTKIGLLNHAKPGASTRTFISEGRWEKVLTALKPGDFVLIQFGHNDQAAINDSTRAKGTLKGIGEETEQIFNLKTRQPETVHTYGWYMRRLIRETKEKGAIPVVCSLVPREKWTGNKVNRETDYVNWAGQSARSERVCFIDLNLLISQQWEAIGPAAVRTFFPGDHTHTNLSGASLNAAIVAEGIRNAKDCPLSEFLK